MKQYLKQENETTGNLTYSFFNKETNKYIHVDKYGIELGDCDADDFEWHIQYILEKDGIFITKNEFETNLNQFVNEINKISKTI